jgi:hypothetical protein
MSERSPNADQIVGLPIAKRKQTQKGRDTASEDQPTSKRCVHLVLFTMPQYLSGKLLLKGAQSPWLACLFLRFAVNFRKLYLDDALRPRQATRSFQLATHVMNGMMKGCETFHTGDVCDGRSAGVWIVHERDDRAQLSTSKVTDFSSASNVCNRRTPRSSVILGEWDISTLAANK